MILIVFGKAGAGKSHIGELFATYYHYHHLDADILFTDQMKQYVREERAFTQAMRDEYTDKLKTALHALQKQHKNIVLSQALYRQTNRLELKNFISWTTAQFIFIDTEDAICYQRITKRNNWITPSYAKKMAANFEPPNRKEQFYTIKNNHHSEQDILRQIDNTMRKIALQIRSSNIPLFNQKGKKAPNQIVFSHHTAKL